MGPPDILLFFRLMAVRSTQSARSSLLPIHACMLACKIDVDNEAEAAFRQPLQCLLSPIPWGHALHKQLGFFNRFNSFSF